MLSARKIKNIITEWKKEAGLDKKGVIQFSTKNTPPSHIEYKIVLYTNRPGLLIGKGGELGNKYIKKLSEEDPKCKGVEFVETNYYYAY